MNQTSSISFTIVLIHFPFHSHQFSQCNKWSNSSNEGPTSSTCDSSIVPISLLIFLSLVFRPKVTTVWVYALPYSLSSRSFHSLFASCHPGPWICFINVPSSMAQKSWPFTCPTPKPVRDPNSMHTYITKCNSLLLSFILGTWGFTLYFLIPRHLTR